MLKSKITINLPQSDINFLERYAAKKSRTISDLIDEYITLLRKIENYSFHPDIEKYAGFLPNNLDAKATYYHHIIEKHQ